MKPTQITRRDFMKKSGMLLAASAVPSFLQAGEKQSTLSIKKRKIQIEQGIQPTGQTPNNTYKPLFT